MLRKLRPQLPQMKNAVCLILTKSGTGPTVSAQCGGFIALSDFCTKVIVLGFSVQPLCSLCLRGVVYSEFINHGDTENTEVAQRRALAV
jgi:hypothetical protein